MIGPAKIYFIVFGLLTIVGGVMGYVKAGSTISLIAGSVSGILLLLAAFLLPGNLAVGLALAAGVSILLAGRFVPAFIKTGNLMPAGLMSVLSVIGIIMAIVAWMKKERGRVASFRLRTLRRLAFFLFLAALTAIVLRWVSLEKWHRTQVTIEEPAAIDVPAKSPTPTPTPKPPVITGRLETARLFSGITVHAAVDPIPGGAASDERADPQSYVLDLKLQARVPAPNKTIEELAKGNPELARVLPGLAAMLTPDSVSPFFKELYDTKLKLLRENLTRLDQLLSRHNFYDCQTVLQLRHPETHRRAVLLQANMDVDADGSDSDRLPAGNRTSPNFKPVTSFRWPKKSQITNPY